MKLQEYIEIKQQEDGLYLPNLSDFSLGDILDCGQCFRFYPIELEPESPYVESYEGVAMGKYLHLSKDSQNGILFHDTSVSDFEEVWYNYFDLATDYTGMKQAFQSDETLRKATTYAPGIRVLRQDGWEALCCFIISQNNNIKRIKGIVARFCQDFGKPIPGHSEWYTFPCPEDLAGVTVEDLAPLRAGFRAKYLVDAVEKVLSGQLDLQKIPQLPLDEAKAQLMQIKGVGPKVADCALLYGFGRMECIPMDVWMKRVMEKMFPDGLPDCAKPYAGIAQQYLFHYARTCPEAFASV